MSDTVRLGYSSSKNISFNGQVDTGISWDEWNEMTSAEQEEEMQTQLNELVEMWVEDE